MPVNHLYEVIGRNKPTEKNPNPQIFRMKLFAQNKPIAESRFWYFLRQLNKSKAALGEIIRVTEIFEQNPGHVKNYGISIRYNSRSGTHNMYKEYRDVTINGAVDQMYAELAGRHRARRSAIQIVDTCIVPTSKLQRDVTKQYVEKNLKFKLYHRIPRPATKAYKSVFAAKRPVGFF